jgi:hypothetical protein
MAQRYATTEQVQRLLETRLQVNGAINSSFGSAFGAQKINPLLLAESQESIEASVDATLSLIYQLPIVSIEALNILRSIVCKLVVADIIPIHFFATSNPQIGGDSGFGAVVRNEGIKELERYTAGYGVYYPSNGGSSVVPRTGNQIQQCIPLPGVLLKPTSQVNRTIQPFDCYSVDTSIHSGDTNYINWGV